MKLATQSSGGVAISLVAMIDILMIMLVFFMVTSTYLNLDMIPVSETTDAPETGASRDDARSTRVLLRLSADGEFVFRGRSVTASGLPDLFATQLALDQNAEFILLPSSRASVQDLVAAMDAAANAGAVRLRVVRLEALP